MLLELLEKFSVSSVQVYIKRLKKNSKFLETFYQAGQMPSVMCNKKRVTKCIQTSLNPKRVSEVLNVYED